MALGTSVLAVPVLPYSVRGITVAPRSSRTIRRSSLVLAALSLRAGTSAALRGKKGRCHTAAALLLTPELLRPAELVEPRVLQQTTLASRHSLAY